MTFRVRINEADSGTAKLVLVYGTGTSRNAYDSTNQAGKATLVSGITPTNGKFIDLVGYFTTPDEYTVLGTEEEPKPANRLYVGIEANKTALSYDLDYIKIEKATNTNLYIKNGESFELLKTVSGVPGTELDLPEQYIEEFYSSDKAAGGIIATRYDGWYKDTACTETPVLKYGNFDVNLYCSGTTTEPSTSTENQDIFVGFDKYTDSANYRTAGLSSESLNVVMTDAYSGTSSLFADLSSNEKAYFELKNDQTADITGGKTYYADFYYKAENGATLTLGKAQGSVKNAFTPFGSVQLSASDEWTKASLVFTADGMSAGDILVGEITSATAGTVFIDTVTVCSAIESVGVEAETTAKGEALRFMMMYAGDDYSKFTLNGKEFTATEHGVLVKAAENSAELTLENKAASGVFSFSQTDLTKNWSENSVTGSTVYSVYLNGFTDLDYEVTVRGYVKTNDGNVFYSDYLTASVNDVPAEEGELIPDGADLSDYYIYFPEGTVFESTEGLTAYNELFIEINDAFSGKALAKGSYIKFNAAPDMNTVTVPNELKYTVHSGSKDELYYGIDVSLVNRKLDKVGKSSVNYIFITDTHYKGWSSSDTQDKILEKQIKLVKQIADSNDNIDFVVVGGDITTGQYETKENMMLRVHQLLDALQGCKKPVFVLNGNHDDKSYSAFSVSEILTDWDWDKGIIERYSPEGVVQDTKRPESKYFYYDLDGKKTRIVVLDSSDFNGKYNAETGVMTELALRNDTYGETDYRRYYNGWTYMGYSAPQIRWLAEEALGTKPADYEVVFLSHMGIDYATNSSGATVYSSEELREVIEAYQNKSTYTATLKDIWQNDVSVNADFSSKNGKIVSYQFGHTHVEASIYSADIDLWQINTNSSNVEQSDTQTYEALAKTSLNNKKIPWRVYVREKGAQSEASFNVMSVSSEQIYRFSIGAGINQKLIYPN